jgi:hypothetical protein
MLKHDNIEIDRNAVNGPYTLSRNNLEFAGVVVYFFSLAVIFAMSIIVMMCQYGNSLDEKSANDHQPLQMVSSADYR